MSRRWVEEKGVIIQSMGKNLCSTGHISKKDLYGETRVRRGGWKGLTGEHGVLRWVSTEHQGG